MTPKEAFKVAFLEKCILNGMTLDEIHSSVKKALDAAECMEKSGAYVLDDILKALVSTATSTMSTGGNLLSSALSTGGNIASTAGKMAWPILVFGPLAAGAAGGYGLAKMTDLSEDEEKLIRKRELIAEYNRQAKALKRQKLARRYSRKAGKKRMRLL